jgi:hypothetical protein
VFARAARADGHFFCAEKVSSLSRTFTRGTIENSQAFEFENPTHLHLSKFPSSTCLFYVMKKKLETDAVIENLIVATLGENTSARQYHIYRENLRALVRLAKSEQVVEIKTNVQKLAGAIEAHSARRRAKAILLAQRLPSILEQAQQQFEFKQ